MNEPIGRFGSCRPARARRTAVETASTASRWPTTRREIASSMWRSFSRSPSSILSTGMPVQRETTPALRLPAGRDGGRLLLEVGELLLRPLQPVLRGQVGLLLQGLGLDAHDLAVDVVELLGLGV